MASAWASVSVVPSARIRADAEIAQIDAAEDFTFEESLIARAEGLLTQSPRPQLDAEELRFGRLAVNRVADPQRTLRPDKFMVEVYKTGHGAGLCDAALSRKELAWLPPRDHRPCSLVAH